MNLMATQLGTKKEIASKDAKIVVPAMETFIVEGTEYVLKHPPKVAPAEIYVLNGDSTFGVKYASATAATKDAFSVEGRTVTLPTGVEKGTEMFVMYEYEAENAVEVMNSATNFPTGCKFVMEVLGCDVCDQTNLIYAYVIFPNFKLSPDFDWSVATDGTHPFSGKAQQDYCDREKKLFSIIIPGQNDEEEF